MPQNKASDERRELSIRLPHNKKEIHRTHRVPPNKSGTQLPLLALTCLFFGPILLYELGKSSLFLLFRGTSNGEIGKIGEIGFPKKGKLGKVGKIGSPKKGKMYYIRKA